MTTFVIFWAALFTIVFFLAGTCFKALASAFNAVLESISMILAIAGLAAAAVIAISLVYGVIDMIMTGGIEQLVLIIISMVIILGIAGALIFGLGAILLEAAVNVITLVLTAVSFILEKAAFICERGYAKSLAAIVNRVDKC